VQLLQKIHWVDLPSGEGGRLRGLLHPIEAGDWFAAAIIWNLAASVAARGWMRWASIGLLLAACGGLLATESRGPWLAAAIAAPLALVVIAWRRPPARRAAALMAIGSLAAAALVWIVDGQSIQARIERGMEETRQARQQHIYWSSAGLRIGLWKWAWEVFEDHPVIGAGIGDFGLEYERLPDYKEAQARATESSFVDIVPGYLEAKARGEDVTALPRYERGRREAAERLDILERDHAHSTYLHTLARLGLVGAALLAIVLVMALRQAWRAPAAHPPAAHPYADGTFFVILAWIIGAQFDCYDLNGHHLGLLAFAIALSLPYRPAVVRTGIPG
jgi:O-antigen ligase